MKSFFKKLSFVLAFAMIVTMIPATSAKAADVKTAEIAVSGTSEVLSGEVVELAVGETLKVTYLGVPDWKAIAGKTFTSSNEDVAAFNADNRTLVAKSAGATEINFICGDYVIAPFVVVVPQTEYAVNISLGKVNGVWDLNRTEYAFESATAPAVKFQYAGYTDGAATKTLVSSDKNVVTVNNDGTVTPVADGTATVYMTVKNTATGKTTLCAPMEVTVGSGIGTTAPVVTGGAFKAQQVSETKVNLVFANAAAAKAAAEQEISFEADFYGVFLDISYKQDVVVKDNVITVESMSSLSDGWTYKFTISGKEASFVASVGKVASVDFTYANVDNAGVDNAIEYGKAYVNDENLPTDDVFVLIPKFYDAKGIDITETVLSSKDHSVPEFELAIDSELVDDANIEDDDIDDLFDDCPAYMFTAPGTVAFTMTYEYTIEAENDEDDDVEVVLTKTGTVTSSQRPARTFKVVDFALIDKVEAGFASKDDAETYAAKGLRDAEAALKTSFDPVVAAKGTKTIYLGNDEDYYFAAKIQDNYGNTYVYPDGTDSWPENVKFDVDYSKETVFSAAEGGVFTVAPGTGSIVFYAIEENERNNKEIKTFIGSQKLTVKAQRYAQTIDNGALSITTFNVGEWSGSNAETSKSVDFNIKDQYGRGVAGLDRYLGQFECTTKHFTTLTASITDKGNGKYRVTRDGSDYDLHEIDSDGNFKESYVSSSRTYKYQLDIDKDYEALSHLNKNSMTLTVKVENKINMGKDMEYILDPDTATKVDKYYYKWSADTTSVDTFTTFTKNSGFNIESNAKKALKKTATISVKRVGDSKGNYSFGLVPNDLVLWDEVTAASYGVDIADPVANKVATVSNVTAEYGKIYYTVTTPKNATQYKVEALTGDDAGKLKLTFNNIDTSVGSSSDEIQYATPGKYIVNLYYVKQLNDEGKGSRTKAGDRGGKLEKLDTITITVSNSQPKVTYAGLVDTKYIEGADFDSTMTYGWDDDSTSVLENIAKAIKLNYNGEAYYNDDYEYHKTLGTASADLTELAIVAAKTTGADGKLFVSEILVEYRITNAGDDQAYGHQKVKVNKWLYEEKNN